jgi:hypothetical protein
MKHMDYEKSKEPARESKKKLEDTLLRDTS